MPLWILKQEAPWKPSPPDAITNAQIRTIVVRAPTAEVARIVAGSHLVPAPAVHEREPAPYMDSPFFDEDASSCEQLEADGPDTVLAAETTQG